jgi:hypothetical protein
MSKPLPPRSPLVSIRHRKRANGSGYCTRRTKPVLRWQSNKPFIIRCLHYRVIERVAPNRSKRFNLEPYSSHLGNRLQNAESDFHAADSPCRLPRLVPGPRSQKLQPSGAIGFFCERLENAGHARALHTILFTKKAALEIATTWKRAPSDVLGLACGHTRATEISANCGMLLPLFQGQGPRNLRQDVRDAEICVALVGYVLHEIPKPLQR